MVMSRKLFCDICPLTYRISSRKEIILRQLRNSTKRFATEKSSHRLPFSVYQHKSLIQRKLGAVDSRLQKNKAVNLSLAQPKVNGILIKRGETFSFWKLVGSCTARKGYLEGLTIVRGEPAAGIGGGMCQFTNLLHWLALHSPLTITEHHHHNGVDLFPDYNRQVPFGVGTSILYNYLDYRVTNDTNCNFQFIIEQTGDYLSGELLADGILEYSYHIGVENEYFYQRDGAFYRHNQIYRRTIDKKSGNMVKKELLLENDARVMYSAGFIPTEKIKQSLL